MTAMDGSTSQGNYQEQDWSPQMVTDEPRSAGRAFPVWIWGCGGGCLLMIVLVFGGLFWAGNKFYSLMGPEAAWPQVAKIMPFGEERPEGYSAIVIDLEVLRGLMDYIPGMSEDELPDMPLQRIITLFRVDEDGDAVGNLAATLMVLPPGDLNDEQLEELRAIADELSTGEKTEQEVETLQLTFQGREVTAARYASIASAAQQLQETTGPRQVLEIDLTNGREAPIVLQFSDDEPPTVEELEAFFEPFDVWGGA